MSASGNMNTVSTLPTQSIEQSSEKPAEKPILPTTTTSPFKQKIVLLSSDSHPLKKTPTKSVPNSFDSLYATIKKPISEIFGSNGELLAYDQLSFLKTFAHDEHSKELEQELSKISQTQNAQQLLLALSNLLVTFSPTLTDPVKYVLCFYKVLSFLPFLKQK